MSELETDPSAAAEPADLDGLDPEPDTSGTRVRPWDPTRIRITTKHFTLRDISEQLEEKALDLAPDFQRAYVWKERQRTRLVESILLGIPLPAFYFNQEIDGSFQVVDGVQRLSTISLFMSNGHPLVGLHLEHLKDLKGKTYASLDLGLRRRFATTQIVVHIIEPQTPDEVKYDIFSRVNTLGSPLSAQEIRHAMSKATSRDFLRRLVESEEFDGATENYFWTRGPDGKPVRDNRRMTDRELALRYCAFHESTLDEYKQFDSLDSFLLNFIRRIDGGATSGTPVSSARLRELEEAFLGAMRNARDALGKAAFRRWPTAQVRRGPINRALFEAQSIALTGFPRETLVECSSAIVGALRDEFSNVGYLNAVTVATGDAEKVRIRLERTREIITEKMS